MSKKLISIDYTPKLLYIVVFIILSYIEQILWDKNDKKFGFVKNFNSKYEKFSMKEKYSHILILASFSLIKSINIIIYYFVIKNFNKNNNENLKKTLQFEQNQKRRKFFISNNIKYFYILITCEFIFYLLSSLRLFFGYSIYYNKNFINIFINLIGYILSLILGYFLFKERVYKHHKLSLIIFLFSEMTIFVSDPDFNKEKNFIFSIGKSIYPFYIKTFLFNLLIVKLFLEKYIMHNYIINHYLIIGYEGLSGILISIIIILIEIIFIGVKYLKEFAKEIFPELYFYLLIINSYFLFNLEILINFQFNPFYVLLANNYYLFQNLYNGIFRKKHFKNNFCIFLFVIKDIFIIFGILIITEFIVIYRFGLEKYTKKEIEKRAIIESTLSLTPQ